MKLLGKFTITKILVGVATVLTIVGVGASVLSLSENSFYFGLEITKVAVLTWILSGTIVAWKKTKIDRSLTYRILNRIFIVFVALCVLVIAAIVFPPLRYIPDRTEGKTPEEVARLTQLELDLYKTKSCRGCDFQDWVFIPRYREEHSGMPRFSKLNLAKANLSGVYLARTVLWHTDFTGANLTGANLSGAYLDNTTFTDANLTNADLGEAHYALSREHSIAEGAIFCNTTMPDGTINNSGC